MYYACLHPASNTSPTEQWLLPRNFLPWLLGLHQMITSDCSWLEWWKRGRSDNSWFWAALQRVTFLLHNGGSAEQGCSTFSRTDPWNSLPYWLIKVPIRQTLRTGPIRRNEALLQLEAVVEPTGIHTTMCRSDVLQGSRPGYKSRAWWPPAQVTSLTTHVLVILGLFNCMDCGTYTLLGWLSPDSNAFWWLVCWSTSKDMY